MKSHQFIFLLFALLIIGFLTYRVSLSYFSDSGSSRDNILSASAVFPSATPTPTPDLGDVVINEINWAGSNVDGLDEWVELRNMKSYSIDLSGWFIENLGSGTGSASIITIPAGSIPANGFFLISNFNESISKINVIPDLINTAISLLNTGEQLRLKSQGGLLVDTGNDTGAWLAGSNSSPKKSMERKDPPGDGTSNGKWKDATDHNGMDGSGTSDEFASPKNTNSL